MISKGLVLCRVGAGLSVYQILQLLRSASDLGNSLVVLVSGHAHGDSIRLLLKERAEIVAAFKFVTKVYLDYPLANAVKFLMPEFVVSDIDLTPEENEAVYETGANHCLLPIKS